MFRIPYTFSLPLVFGLSVSVNTLTGVSNLVLVVEYQGKYDEAENLNRRALEGWEKELGI